MTDAGCVRRDTCRLCGNGDLSLVIELTPTPPANAFVTDSQLNEEQAVFPLDVFFCESCAHLQLLDVVDPSVLFENYVYVSGTAPAFVKHFDEYAETVINKFVGAVNGKLALDIGSNDGTLLRAFQKRGMEVVGVDPARDIAAMATDAGVETKAAFFTPELARGIRREYTSAAVVTANNVFAHADDLRRIVEGIKAILADDGVFVFEVSYLVDVFEKTLFDTIYHEHLAYHSVKPLDRFFRENGMELFAAERVSSHGGSLRGFAQLAGGPNEADGSVGSLKSLEESLGLDNAETFKRFGGKVELVKRDLGRLLSGMKSQGKSVAGFGAPAKATTLMYHFGIGPTVVDFIVDDSPLKQGLFSPGMHIPVLPSQAIYDKKPDVVIILAWNFADAILANHKRFLDMGGTFIVPLPDIKVFSL